LQAGARLIHSKADSVEQPMQRAGATNGYFTGSTGTFSSSAVAAAKLGLCHIVMDDHGSCFYLFFELSHAMAHREHYTNRHLVQFYENDVFLNDELASYIALGLAAGETCIVIAMKSRLLPIEKYCEQMMGHKSARYVLLDAEDLLAQILVEGWPNAERFNQIVGNIVAAATRHGRVRIFGEMVALLCASGRHDAALHLEKCWNALALRYSFTLLCAYQLDDFADASLSQSFEHICGAHQHTLPSESYSPTDDAAQLHQTIAVLQQKARALEFEVNRRKNTEGILKQRERELSDFLENAVEGLRRVGPDGRIVWANKVELNLLGYQSHEYIGHHVSEFYVDQEVGKDMLRRQLNGETLVDYPVRMRCKNGAIKHVLIHSNAWVVDGHFVSTRCFMRDITDQIALQQERHRQRDQRHAERMLRAANDELEQRVRERTAKLLKSNSQLTEEISERKRAELALQQSQQLLRELGKHTEEIVEQERKRIARELHDQLGQNLMALRIDVLLMQGAAGPNQPEVAATVESALKNIDSMIKNVRSIINNLRPAVLDLGLAATFEWEIKEFERRSGIASTLTTDRSEFNVDDALALALLRILQESLNNVLRHAYANMVDIRLYGDDHNLCLEVADNGVGDYPGCRRKANAYGLLGIEERVAALGGTLSIVTEKGKGLVLTVTLPLPIAAMN
jgi:PAS domain S-box-containing protein